LTVDVIAGAGEQPRARVRAEARSPQTPSVDVARIKERTISLGELDSAGGHSVYDAAEQLYEARVRTLYQMLSTDLLEREARAHLVTQEQLLDREVNSHVKPVSDAEVQEFMQAQPSGGATPDPRARKDTELYLNMKRHGDAKREYIAKLFKKYDVRVMLEAPPPPPAETIQGAVEPALGPTSAPVTIVVFSDYLCPYCRDLATTLDTLLARDPQGVRVIYRHFPVQPQADTLAQAALCAADQGSFADLNRRLFAQTPQLDALTKLAGEAGLDVAKFSTCLNSERHRARVEADLSEGRRLKIQGTPTLFVNGQRLRGAQTLSRLTSQVEIAKQHTATAAMATPPSRR
jgi:protein-disulfide isomerase